MKERVRTLCNVSATARNPLCLLFFAAPYLSASQPNTSPRSLKKLSIEELMNVEVNLVSRTPQKLSEAASAVQVITGEDIQRSGATNIPEALRLINNLQVAQLSANAWIISARGFNTTFANKLLVMIDGRTVYTPLFGGVIGEQQNVLLEDVERIEVVSGPGGSFIKDAKHHAMLQSIIDLPMHFQFDVCLRYLGKLPKTFATEKVDAYTSFDARLAYSFKAIELAVTGHNLAEKNHTKYGTYNIPRSIYLKISTRL